MRCRSDTSRSDNRRSYSRFLAGGVVVVAAALACAACGPPAAAGSGGTASGGSVPVGCETDLTGTYATFGAQALQGCQAGTYAVNHGGGVDGGQMIKLIPADDASDPVDAVAPAEKLVNVSHVVAQDGEAGTNAQGIATIFTRAHLPFMMGGGDVFYDTNTNSYIWRLVAVRLPARRRDGAVGSSSRATPGQRCCSALATSPRASFLSSPRHSASWAARSCPRRSASRPVQLQLGGQQAAREPSAGHLLRDGSSDRDRRIQGPGRGRLHQPSDDRDG